ncbi:threonine/serine exporter family protein, partial [Vibrio sp. 10N.222.49.C9]|uniref:threonine/serine exporter family protein n=1 Tax=Vibrio sp. 10N.222.49.C9 TaxID=3229615 RepID=UPI00354F2FD7
LAQTIQRLRRPNGATKQEPFRYPIWAVALANMSIPPAYLMLIGSTLEAIICSLFLGFMVWGCQMVLCGRRTIAVEFIAALLTGICVAGLSSQGLPIPVYAL